MRGLPTCEQVTALLTDLDEGALGPLAWAGVRLHLGLCPPCQAFLRSLRLTRVVAREQLHDESTPGPAAERALSGALALLRQGRLPAGPSHHPAPEAWQTLAVHPDSPAGLLLRAHLGWCGACRARQGADLALEADGAPVPRSLRALLPPEDQWRWVRRGLGGARIARVGLDAATGTSLNLVQMHGAGQVPTHRHLGVETTLVLAGGLQDGPADLRAGDWISHAAGTCHGPETLPGEACWALVVLEGPIQFTGWRRWLT